MGRLEVWMEGEDNVGAPGFSKGLHTLVNSLVPAENTEDVTVKKGGRSS
jgi:hypothetical protein